MHKSDYDKLYYSAESFAAVLLLTDLLPVVGWKGWIFQGDWHSSLLIKLLSLALILPSAVNKTRQRDSRQLIVNALMLLCGMVLYFFSVRYGVIYPVMTFTGLFLITRSVSLFFGRGSISTISTPDSFPQCEKIIPTPYSVNLSYKYRYEGRARSGWINIVNPFRATLVMGTPGSGKSASIIEPFISQTIGKGFSMVCYDYKYPVLSNHVYSEYLKCSEKTHDHYGNVSFMCLSLSDLRSSMRCNPIVPESITDMTDAFEMAEILLKNLCPETIEREDFFSRSAKALVASSIWYLRSYKEGEYCTLPHLVEFMSLDYKTLLGILQSCSDVGPIMTPFVGAMNEKAQNQLQGQLASAQMPLSTLNSKQLYWLLSKDDVPLDVNNPESPTILCIGSDPARQKTNSAIIALIFSRIFKLINVRGKNPSAIVIDEFPTVYLKGVDELIATARSNKVAVLLGAQDKSQIVRDYGVKEADAIVGTVGNIICGQVNGKTADEISRMFGERKVPHQSTTISDSGESVHDDSRNEKLLPSSEIQTFSQGVFCGRVSDNADTPIQRKLFCGKVDYEKNRVGMGNPESIPMSESFVYEVNSYLDEILRYDSIEKSALRGIVGEDTMLLLDQTNEGERLFVILNMSSDVVDQALSYLEHEIIESNYYRIKREVEEMVRSSKSA